MPRHNGFPLPSDPFWDTDHDKINYWPPPFDLGKLSEEILARLNSLEGRALIAKYREACLKEKDHG